MNTYFIQSSQLLNMYTRQSSNQQAQSNPASPQKKVSTATIVLNPSSTSKPPPSPTNLSTSSTTITLAGPPSGSQANNPKQTSRQEPPPVQTGASRKISMPVKLPSTEELQKRLEEVTSPTRERKASVPTKHIIDVEKEREENLAKMKMNKIKFDPVIRSETRKKKDFTYLLSGGGRKANIKNLLMKKAQEELAREKEREEADKRKVLAERVPALKVQGKNQEQLVEYCEYLVEAIKKAEAEKWDLEFTMKENDQKIMDLKQKAMEGTGKYVKPPLKRTGVNLNKSAAQAEIERRKQQARMRMQALKVKAGGKGGVEEDAGEAEDE
ncbi:uncharacterized protein LOC142339517 isoform X2 [Convolutriloba macropyga]|uniref:uncharacterized protein LOC142339517 isoform X2 n=1 Tax=Convolutriloba macropyga TaxID=536237 RepID=UPI003F51E637